MIHIGSMVPRHPGAARPASPSRAGRPGRTGGRGGTDRQHLALAALEAGHAVAFCWDLRRDVVTLSGAVDSVLGLEAATPALTTAEKLACVRPKDRGRFMAALQAARRTGSLLCSYGWICADGRIVQLLDSGSIAGGSAGRLQGITVALPEPATVVAPDACACHADAAGAATARRAVAAGSAGEPDHPHGPEGPHARQAPGDHDRRENDWRLRLMIEANPIGVLQGDIYGRIFAANDAFLRLVGYSRADLESGRLTWTALTPAEHLPSDRQAIEEARATGVCKPYEKVYIRKDGTTVPVLVGYTLFDDRRELSVAFVLDLTEVRQARDALQAALDVRNRLLAQKDALMRELNHRVKNSLQMVSSMLRLQARATDDARVCDALAEAERRVMTIARLHDQLRHPGESVGTIDLGRYLHDLGAELAATLVTPGGPVALEVAAEPLVLAADRAVHVGLIVNELTTNAAKHAFPDRRSGDRAGHIRVSLETEAADGLCLSVTDDGCGLPLATTAGPLPRSPGGFGFPLVELLATALEAALRVESGVGGTRVSLHFRAVPV